MRALKRPDLDDVHAQFEAWRVGARVRRSIPEALLRAAVALLNRYTPSTICRRLRLNAALLGRARQALEAAHAKAPGVAATAPQAPLIRLDALGHAAAECHVVLEPAIGGRVSVELARVDAATPEPVCRSLLDAAGGPTTTANSVLRSGAATAR